MGCSGGKHMIKDDILNDLNLWEIASDIINKYLNRVLFIENKLNVSYGIYEKILYIKNKGNNNPIQLKPIKKIFLIKNETIINDNILIILNILNF